MLQSANQGFYCGLVCQMDSQCPSGNACKIVSNVGICIKPLSFAEWSAGQGQRQKLMVAYPNAAGPGVKQQGFQIAKAYAALQSLKTKFNINDGDVDVLTIKELLMSAHGAMNTKPSTAVSSISTPSLFTGAASTGGSGSSPSRPAGNGEGSIMGDVNHLMGNLAKGPAGWEREFVHDTEWNIEQGRYWVVLRDLLTYAIIYLVVGSAYKYHTQGSRGMDMIPNIGFWMEYPDLVKDGVQYTIVTVSGVLGIQVSKGQGMSSSSDFQTIGRPGRDNGFAALEPSL
jgi:hypothetical protein